MSIDYDAIIMVGLPAEEVCEDYDSFYERWEDGGFDLVPCWYDAEFENSSIGFIIKCVEYGSMDIGSFDEFKKDIDEAHKLFKDKTGKEGKVLLTTRGS